GCDNGNTTVHVGPLTEIPFLPMNDGGCVLNYAAEASIAASAGHVALAHIDVGLTDARTAAFCDKRVSVAVSDDSGQTYGAPIDVPGLSSYSSLTTDPVIMADAGGRFWLAALNGYETGCYVGMSADHGASWQPVVSVPGSMCVDKEWIA